MSRSNPSTNRLGVLLHRRKSNSEKAILSKKKKKQITKSSAILRAYMNMCLRKALYIQSTAHRVMCVCPNTQDRYTVQALKIFTVHIPHVHINPYNWIVSVEWWGLWRPILFISSLHVFPIVLTPTPYNVFIELYWRCSCMSKLLGPLSPLPIDRVSYGPCITVYVM